MWERSQREKRLHAEGKPDQRDPFQRDRDRILYSSAFRRLSGITQIVRAGEADVFHTRQQHTLKVAQVGLRMAESLVKQQGEDAEFWGVSPEVVEAACLAHDLGHPPFGHIGEYLLNDLVEQSGDQNGFEGNAQSFRILTKLALRFDSCAGLDLTRATLAACLKYPWHRDDKKPHQKKKWGAYHIDALDFEFARQTFVGDSRKTAEAEIMDWADDIAYSVHDLEDFHRCGMIPWRRLLEGDLTDGTVRRAVNGWFDRPGNAIQRVMAAVDAIREALRLVPQIYGEVYEGTKQQRQQLRYFTSSLIGRYISAIKLSPADSDAQPAVIIDDSAADEVRFLKQITRDYIIRNPNLAAQQHGQKRIIRELFASFVEDGRNGIPSYLPIRLHYLWDFETGVGRRAADAICSMTEAEAVALHGRLTGTAAGSVLDPILR